MSSQNAYAFRFLRATVWPIRSHEIRRVLLISALLFFVCFNYSLLRCLKDTVVVTAASSAAVIPFIKVWALLPMAVLFTFIYAHLSARLNRNIVFYLIASSALVF